MDILTIKNIEYVGENILPKSIIHPTSIAYIQSLLKPYAETIDSIVSIKDIEKWISISLPNKFAKKALESMEEAKKMINEKEKIGDGKKETLEKYNKSQVIATVKNAVIGYLIIEIFSLDLHEQVILPWDIQVAISKDSSLSQMFKITKKQNQLPVTVGNQQLTQMLSMEFVAGLLLFSAPTVGNHDFQLIISGKSIPSDCIIGKGIHSRFSQRNEYPHYSMEVGDNIYYFSYPDFIRGFITGALWKGVDHHNYRKKIVQYTIDPDTKEIVATDITF